MKAILTLIALMMWVSSAHALTPQSFKKTVTTAGTGEPLVAKKTLARGRVIIRALAANTNNVYVGDSDVDKTTKDGIELDALQEVVIDPGVINGRSAFVDLSKIYIDVDTGGEGVTVFYFED